MDSSSATDFIVKLSQIVEAWRDPIFYIAAAAGITMMLGAIIKALDHGREARVWRAVVIRSLSATMLMNLAWVITVGSRSELDGQTSNFLSYSVSGTSPAQIWMHASVNIIMFMGMLAVIRAIFLFRNLEYKPEELGRAITFFCAGILACNYDLFLQMLGVTFGGEFQSTLSALMS